LAQDGKVNRVIQFLIFRTFDLRFRQALAELGYEQQGCYGGSVVGEMTGSIYSNLNNGVCVELNYSSKFVSFSYVVKRTVFTLASPELYSRQNDLERFKRELKQFEDFAEKLL
jgi:hypothetical protein